MHEDQAILECLQANVHSLRSACRQVIEIYHIMAWRAGETALLQSSLTRAMMFSAMTTATGFGSLWLSNHPGTSSMGKLMALALATTMTAAVFFQPALMGPPRPHVG